MPTICRLLRLTPDRAVSLIAEHGSLAEAVASANIYSDVYRYWHGIQYLLAQHSPESPAANWLGAGDAVSEDSKDVPAARVILPRDVALLAESLQGIEPDELAPYYDAGALDRAGIYPGCWEDWEETFDPLGQMLEYYSYHREFAMKRASSGEALLLYFEFLDDGSDS